MQVCLSKAAEPVAVKTRILTICSNARGPELLAMEVYRRHQAVPSFPHSPHIAFPALHQDSGLSLSVSHLFSGAKGSLLVFQIGILAFRADLTCLRGAALRSNTAGIYIDRALINLFEGFST